MKLLVRLLCLPDGRRTAFRTGYRPDWRSDRKPELNGAQVSLPRSVGTLAPGASADALLTPFDLILWVGLVEVGDELRGYEGFKQTVSGVVLEVFEP